MGVDEEKGLPRRMDYVGNEIHHLSLVLGFGKLVPQRGMD